jgi:hypothetical protein
VKGISAGDPLAKAAELAQLVAQSEQIVPCIVQRGRPLRAYVTHVVWRWERETDANAEAREQI